VSAAVVVGAGARAVRVFFTAEGVQLRHGATVIDGNADAAAALRWVIDHPDVDEHLMTAQPPGSVDLEAACATLRYLARAGVPPSYWGPAWAHLCEAGEERVGHA
jgi:hypothetical protein